MTRDDVSAAAVTISTLAFGALSLWLITSAVVRECGNYREGERLDRELGPVHCGEVDVMTPGGNHAVEHQCWRAKSDAGSR